MSGRDFLFLNKLYVSLHYRGRLGAGGAGELWELWEKATPKQLQIIKAIINAVLPFLDE